MWDRYIEHLLVLVGIYSILGMSVNLSIGYTGLLNLGHVAFFGIGAYTAAILTKQGIPFIPALLCSGLFAALAGLLLIRITHKLKGDFLVLATFSFTLVVYTVLLNWISLTNGPLGMAGIPKAVIAGFAFKTLPAQLLLVWAIVALIAFFLYRLTISPYGKLLQGVRDDERGLAMLGKNTALLKYQSMIISAFLAGVAGSLYAHYMSYIDPSSFYLMDIIVLLTIVIVGGLASLRGTFYGAFLILLLPEAVRFLSLPPSLLGPIRQMVYAIALILILRFAPRGLNGKVDIR